MADAHKISVPKQLALLTVAAALFLTALMVLVQQFSSSRRSDGAVPSSSPPDRSPSGHGVVEESSPGDRESETEPVSRELASGSQDGELALLPRTPGVSIEGSVWELHDTEANGGEPSRTTGTWPNSRLELVVPESGRIHLPFGEWRLECLSSSSSEQFFVKRPASLSRSSPQDVLWVDREWSTTVLVLDAAGHPVPGATVGWRERSDAEAWSLRPFGWPSDWLTRESDATGSVRMEGMRESTGTLVASHPDFGEARAAIASEIPKMLELRLAPWQERARIAFVDLNGERLEGVRYRKHDAPRESTSDAQGFAAVELPAQGGGLLEMLGSQEVYRSYIPLQDLADGSTVHLPSTRRAALVSVLGEPLPPISTIYLELIEAVTDLDAQPRLEPQPPITIADRRTVAAPTGCDLRVRAVDVEQRWWTGSLAKGDTSVTLAPAEGGYAIHLTAGGLAEPYTATASHSWLDIEATSTAGGKSRIAVPGGSPCTKVSLVGGDLPPCVLWRDSSKATSGDEFIEFDAPPRASVRLQVLDSNDKPVAGAHVTLSRTTRSRDGKLSWQTERGSWRLQPQPLSATTDLRGFAEFRTAFLGNYDVYVEFHWERLLDPAHNLTRRDGTPVWVDESGVQPHSVRVPEWTYVHLSVFDQESGSALYPIFVRSMEGLPGMEAVAPDGPWSGWALSSDVLMVWSPHYRARQMPVREAKRTARISLQRSDPGMLRFALDGSNDSLSANLRINVSMASGVGSGKNFREYRTFEFLVDSQSLDHPLSLPPGNHYRVSTAVLEGPWEVPAERESLPWDGVGVLKIQLQHKHGD